MIDTKLCICIIFNYIERCVFLLLFHLHDSHIILKSFCPLFCFFFSIYARVFLNPDLCLFLFSLFTNIAEVLTRDLFQPGRSFSSEHKSKYCVLLAMAASVRDARARGGILDRAELESTRRAIERVQPICRADPTGSELQAVLPTLVENMVCDPK